MVNENQSIQPARASRTLPVLLLACAGALLIIFISLASALSDAQSSQIAHATTTAGGTCGLSAQTFVSLPQMLQLELKNDCATQGEPVIR